MDACYFFLNCENADLVGWRHNGNSRENEAQQEGNERYKLQRPEIWSQGNPVSCGQ